MNTTSPRSRRRLAGFIAAGVLALAACGSDRSSDAPGTDGPAGPGTTSPEPPTTTAATPADGGWIGGEPDWSGGDVAGDAMEAEPAGGDMAMSDADARVEAADIAAESAPVEPSPGDDIVAPPSDQPLRAGSVDDGADFAGFVEYVDRVTDLGFVARAADLTGRIVVSVVDDEGVPVAGVELVASQGDAEPVSMRTTADGTARLFPGLHGFDAAAPVDVGLAGDDGGAVAADAGSEVTIVAPAADLGAPVPLDVLFLLDATGSMGDEIDRLKQTIDTVADRVNQLEPRPDVRFAMTLYRDEGDAFVSSTFDFTSDVSQFRDALAEVVADGGGDYPEALDEGLAEALNAPAWRDPAGAVQLVFLVADAPPQIARQVPTPYTDSIRTAIERGIKIFPIASSESDDVAELVFRQLAVTTGAPFVFLSYGAGGAATGGATDITSTDYEELALDELVVRLIAEELADLTGGEGGPTPPTTVAPPTTNPDGQ